MTRRVRRDIRVEPVTPDRWDDLVELFGERGASSGCWCMWFRQSASDFEKKAGRANRRAMESLVDEGRVPGLLAYLGGEPVGWCSLAPRDEFPRLDRSTVLKRVDDAEVWSVVCFYIDRHHRGDGVATALLAAAERFAAGRGARWLEAYPIDSAAKIANASAYTGVLSLFEAAGYREVARRRDTRPIVRKRLRMPSSG